MWPQIAREQLGAGNAGFATSWELPGSWEPGSLLRKDIAWEAILGIKTTGHESHEQHTFTSPYPCGVAGLVKKRGILAAPEHPFSLLLMEASHPHYAHRPS